MKTLQCDLCDHVAQGETFEEWVNALKPHYGEAHAEIMRGKAHSTDEEKKAEMQKWMSMSQKIFTGVCAAMVAALAPFAIIHAAEYFPKSAENMDNVSIGGEATFRNLYVAGGTVTVNKQVFGDLFAAGGSVNIAGPIEEDLAAAGGSVNIASPIGEDARIAGGNVSVNAPIGGDLLAAGGTVVLSESANVGGDLWIAGGVVNVNGSVSGEARIAGGEIFINGTLAGPITVHTDEKLTFGPQARATGTITYFGKKEAVILEGAEIGAIEFAEWKKADRAKAGMAFLGAFIVWKLLALLTASLLLFKFFRSRISQVAVSSQENFWACLGVGILALFMSPIVAMLLAATIIGIYAGILLGVLFAFLLLAAGVIVIVLLGHIVEQLIYRGRDISPSWMSILWGILASAVLVLIPVIGWLAIFILFLAAFGALWRGLWQEIEK